MGGGAKLPTLSKIFPDDPFLMKLHENVITTSNLTFLIVENLWRHQFAYISIISAAGRHISAKNACVTRMLVKKDLQIRLTCMTHQSLAKELLSPLLYVLTKFRGFMTSWKLLISAEVQYREFWQNLMIFLTKKCVESLGGLQKYKNRNFRLNYVKNEGSNVENRVCWPFLWWYIKISAWRHDDVITAWLQPQNHANAIFSGNLLFSTTQHL